MQEDINITASLEDYLKTIHQLETQDRVARAKDIARHMSVSRASVTGALKSLSQKGLIDYSPYSYITLTEDGRGLARNLIKKHAELCRFFIGVMEMDQAPAEDLACKLEHEVDSELIQKLASLRDFISICPHGFDCWKAFRAQGRPGLLADNCRGLQMKSLCTSCRDEIWPKADKL